MKNQKGVTLIELLVSFVITSLIIAGVYQIVINQARNYEIQEQIVEAQNSVRAGMEIMAADLRMAGYDKEGGGSTVSVTNPVSGSSNIIRVEWERDDNIIESIEYFLSGRQLQRNVYLNGVLDSQQVVLDQVSDLNFAYKMSGTRFVKVDLTLAVENRDLSTSVSFRNVR
jgi:prepilin-type N-terminal cleavage/methylation domain-containing protein